MDAAHKCYRWDIRGSGMGWDWTTGRGKGIEHLTWRTVPSLMRGGGCQCQSSPLTGKKPGVKATLCLPCNFVFTVLFALLPGGLAHRRGPA